MKSEIGVIGLGVMGKSLSRNLALKGFKISIYNRHVAGQEENIAVDFKHQHPELAHALPHDDLKIFVASLEAPRKIILMVNAGAAVDAVSGHLSDLLESGDIVIDGGNSHFEDTYRRMETAKEQGMFFIGAGISGGEEGALTGPAIMPSGDKTAYLKVQKYLNAIAAKDGHGNPCCTYVGGQGSGHFIKTIHNGIEYVEMQLLAECYSILKSQGMPNNEIAAVFESWMKDLGSYLLRITVQILRTKEGDAYLLDKILDVAGNKGTGKWATALVADAGEPATMIPTALFARYLSFFKEQRERAARVFPTAGASNDVSFQHLKDAYQFGRIINHHQGFAIMASVSSQRGWHVDLSEIARIWTGGCIIMSDFMKELVECLKTDSSILFNDELSQVVKKTHAAARSVAVACMQQEIHAPCLLEAVNYFHGIKTANGPANLIQAQRDFFGAHTYQRIDDSSGNGYHTEW